MTSDVIFKINLVQEKASLKLSDLHRSLFDDKYIHAFLIFQWYFVTDVFQSLGGN